MKDLSLTAGQTFPLFPAGPAFRVYLVAVLDVGKRLSIAMANGKFYENRLMLCVKCVLVCIHFCGHLDFGITGT